MSRKAERKKPIRSALSIFFGELLGPEGRRVLKEIKSPEGRARVAGRGVRKAGKAIRHTGVELTHTFTHAVVGGVQGAVSDEVKKRVRRKLFNNNTNGGQ